MKHPLNQLKGQLNRLRIWTARKFILFSPNTITIAGAILIVLGVPLFIPNSIIYYTIAVVLLTMSYCTDFIDGTLSRAQQGNRSLLTREQESGMRMRDIIDYRGVTHFGRWSDPFVDKVRFLGIVLVLGPGFVWNWLVQTLVLTAIALILVRPILRFLDLGDGASNIFGKIKVIVEIFAICTLVFTPNDLLRTFWGNMVLQGLMLSALVLACLSLL